MQKEVFMAADGNAPFLYGTFLALYGNRGIGYEMLTAQNAERWFYVSTWPSPIRFKATRSSPDGTKPSSVALLSGLN